MSISLRYISDIHCGLGEWVSGGVGFSTPFSAWKIVSTRIVGPVSSASERARLPFRYPPWHHVGYYSNHSQREKWSDAKFCGSWMPFFLTYFCPITGHSHTGIRGFAPGIPATTYLGCGSEGVVENYPIDLPSQRKPGNL